MRRAAIATWLAIAIAAATGGGSRADPLGQAYAVGQVWQYRVRPGDEGSLLKIGRIETEPPGKLPGPIYHISIIAVHLGRAHVVTVIGHAPVSKATLDSSVTTLVSSDADFPDVSAGIEQWRAAKGGVFTISVAEIVAYIDAMLHAAGWGPARPFPGAQAAGSPNLAPRYSKRPDP